MRKWGRIGHGSPSSEEKVVAYASTVTSLVVPSQIPCFVQ
jgi:hypothetical protein